MFTSLQNANMKDSLWLLKESSMCVFSKKKKKKKSYKKLKYILLRKKKVGLT